MRRFIGAQSSRIDAGPAPSKSMRVLQISDTHLFADRDAVNEGRCNYRSLAAVLEHVRAAPSRADLIVFTGDLVHDGSQAGYQHLHELLLTVDVPVFCLPGNHDDPQRMRKHLPGANVSVATATRIGEWQFLFLDTHLPGSAAGHLHSEQLTQLGTNLTRADVSHALVFLHHPPVTIGSSWMDAMRLDNPEALFAVIAKHPQIQAVAWGHIHQEFVDERDGVRLYGAPSTCVQFKPLSEEFAIDPLSAGYRWFELGPGGGLRTGVVRVDC